MNWVKKMTGPPAVTVEDVDKLKDLEGANDVLVLGYFSAFQVCREAVARRTPFWLGVFSGRKGLCEQFPGSCDAIPPFSTTFHTTSAPQSAR